MKTTPDGKQVDGYEPPEKFYWLHGLEEYLTIINHKQLEEFYDIKKVVLHGNIWKMKKRIIHEIQRGFLNTKDGPTANPLTVEFVNILFAHYTGWKFSRHRKILRYVAHCIDDDFIRKISSWSIKWQSRANLNDHFSRGQMRSKMWMVNELKNCMETNYLGNVFHYGGWYATIAKLLFDEFRIKQYFNFEKDPYCMEISEDFNYEQHRRNWEYKCITRDVSNILFGPAGDEEFDVVSKSGEVIDFCVVPDIVINTSCEHMNEDWFHNLPDGQMVCLQTNDYFANEQHSNCCKDLQDEIEKYPMSKLLYSGEIDTELYNRFMLIGHK